MYDYSGIYKITNLKNGKVYIGQSKHIRKRLSEHRRELLKGEHFNRHLQFAVNEYGMENFLFSVIQRCDEEALDMLECFWIRQYRANDRLFGYNIDGGGSANRIIADSTRKKMSRNFTGEHSNTAVISEQTAIQIIMALIRGDSIHGIAKRLNISHKIVEGIRRKKTWKYLTKTVQFPDKRSSKYKWVTKIETPNQILYRSVVRVDGKNVYAKCWDSEYDAAVARELYIREHDIKDACRNFPDELPLAMPKKKVHGKSRFYGVTHQSSHGKSWTATVGNTYIGSFPTEELAAKARERYIVENHVKRVRHNKI